MIHNAVNSHFCPKTLYGQQNNYITVIIVLHNSIILHLLSLYGQFISIGVHLIKIKLIFKVIGGGGLEGICLLND